MSWEPQGLIKYECRDCNKQFIVGLIDHQTAKPQRCSFCGSERIEGTAAVDPDEKLFPWLWSMGCMGIHYDQEELAYLQAEREGLERY